MRRTLVWMLLAVAGISRAQVDLSLYPVFENDKISPAELRVRREAIKKSLGSGTVAVCFTNPERNRNNDVDFLFRGDSNFLYLTGFEEPDAALLLAPDGVTIDGKRVTEALFVNEADLGSITWLGYRMGPANAVKLLGIESAYSNRQFANVLQQAMVGKPKLTSFRLPAGPVGTLKRMIDAFAEAQKASDPFSGPNPTQTANNMRRVKSAAEIAFMRKVCDISAKSHNEAIRGTKPNMREWEIAAMVQYGFAKAGCEFVGYPSICGSGMNGTILHYESNRRQALDGELFLMDAAGEYHGYSADVTRTWPVNGKFTPEQKAIYQIVYDAQTKGISMCKAGASMGAIAQAISKVLADGLIQLGLIKNANELSRYYMHGFGHGIGLDVHDPVADPLVAGTLLTVEPGIYIKAGSPCDKKWWNIGVRIEDDILVTNGAPENLSAAAPRTWQAIEKLMRQRK